MNFMYLNLKMDGIGLNMEFKELYETDNNKLREDYTILLEKHNIVNVELSGFHVILETLKE